MRNKRYELDRVILEAVSDDYESFESIVSKLSHPGYVICGISEIEHSLLGFIANNLVGAYLIHADPPYATAVGANIDTVRRYWFFITDKGKAYLHTLPRKHGVSRRGKAR